MLAYSKSRCDNLQSELNQTQIGIGLSGDGSYSSDQETHYLKNATSVMNALKTLDTLIYQVAESSVKDIKMSTIDAELDKDGNIVDGTGSTALCISYILSDGSFKLVHLDYQKFIEETEFGDGLAVDNHVVKASIAESTENNKNFLELNELK